MTSALDPCVTQLGLQHKPIFHASMHEILMAINGFVLRESQCKTREIEMRAAGSERSELHTFTFKLVNQNETRRRKSNFSTMPEQSEGAIGKFSVPD